MEARWGWTVDRHNYHGQQCVGVRLLLERADVDADSEDMNGWRHCHLHQSGGTMML